MTKVKTAIAVAIGTLFAGAAFAQSNYSIEQRDRNEDMRIEQGIRSGQLTRQEASRLESERAQVERMERRARSDGVVTQQERNRITRAQDRVSRDIYRESHDSQTANRGGWRGNEHGWRGNDRNQGWDHRNGNNDRRFDNGPHSVRFNNRDRARTEHSQSQVHSQSQTDHTGPRAGTDFNRGRSDSAPGRQPHLQQTPVQQARVQVAQASRPTTVARQGGNSDHRTH